ncbi:hypothetical protein B0T10DRAFT_493811 [Thelonectria olida]|uniref:C2H2-type domain-containing protein n=1 Tax=Thelonectria olida TaxID=1576542 RepID=A0A9P8VXN4_9HYPO|nr:hypothetical protein B0T10DRAFT_493811 [Thelonectria olida]
MDLMLILSITNTQVEIPQSRSIAMVYFSRIFGSRCCVNTEASPTTQTHSASLENAVADRIYCLPHRPASGISGMAAESPPASTALPSSGTKRTRYGQPKIPSPKSVDSLDRPDYGTISSPETDREESPSSRFDSDSDDSFYIKGSYQSDSDGQGNIDVDALVGHNKYQSAIQTLVQRSHLEAEAWISSARYVPPPDDDNSRPGKRLRSCPERRGSFGVQQEEDEGDGELVIVSQVQGYFHLACPFYVHDSQKHQACLRDHHLQSIEDVIKHVRQHHKKPPYCPICFQTFDNLCDRDVHVRERACPLRALDDIDGINEYQRGQLRKIDEVGLGETRRWTRIWRTVFPNVKPSPSPFLTDDCGLAVSMTRDYWGANGRGCVSQYLADEGLLGEDSQDEEREQVALYNNVLEGLISKVSNEHRPGQSK